MEIVMPAYNCIETIGAALDSLVDQKNKNFTVLIIDDCSSQDIHSIIKNYEDKLNIHYLRNEKNLGCGMTRQRGIDETTADYIAFLDSDDKLFPEAVDVWLKEIEANHPDVIYSPWKYQLGFITFTQVPFPLGMCHGKVYNVEFLREYDVRESPEILCKDDIYLNLQAFDLARKVSILKDYTYLYIANKASVTNQEWFVKRYKSEEAILYEKASERITRFKDNSIKQYKELERQIREQVFGNNLKE